jgi:hypothetical protein
MFIPRHWAKAEGTARDADGSEFQLTAWGCAATSRADAEADARTRLAATIRRIQDGSSVEGGYGYTRGPKREAILSEVAGSGGTPTAIVTRNHYGCSVLNTARTLFMDIDLPADSIASRVFGLFRGKKDPPEVQRLEQLRAALNSVAGASFRIYRTAAGFRVLGTDRLYGPSDAATVALMQATATDPAFVTLCKAQECFRARLTPKPWRIGLGAPRFAHPAPSVQAEQAGQDWQRSYEATCRDWATCKFLERCGREVVHPEMAPILKLHDTATRCESSCPLA